MDIPQTLDELAGQVEQSEFTRPILAQVAQEGMMALSWFSRLRGKKPTEPAPFLLDFWRISCKSANSKVYGLLTTYSNDTARFDAAWWVFDNEHNTKAPLHHGSIEDMTLTYVKEGERVILCQKTLAAALRELGPHQL